MKKTLMLISAVLILIMILPLASFASEKNDRLPFMDISEGKWYYENVKKAYETNLMDGVSDYHFKPDGTLTRGMCATILYRAANEPDFTESKSFADVESGKYYEKAVTWAKGKGIVNGKTKATFDPNGKITREEFATMLYRYLDSAKLTLNAKREGTPADELSIANYAKEAVGTMYRAEVVNGRENGEFDPDASITRAEASAMITRFLDNATFEDDEDVLTIGFFGEKNISGYGIPAQLEAIAEGKKVEIIDFAKGENSDGQIYNEWSALLQYESNREKIDSLDVIVVMSQRMDQKYARYFSGWSLYQPIGDNEFIGSASGDPSYFTPENGWEAYQPVLPKLRELFGTDKQYVYFANWDGIDFKADDVNGRKAEAKINQLKDGFKSEFGFDLVLSLGEAQFSVAGVEENDAVKGFCSALYIYNQIFGEAVTDLNNGTLSASQIPGNSADEDAAYMTAIKAGVQLVIDEPQGAFNTLQYHSFGGFASQILNEQISLDDLPGDTPEEKAEYLEGLKEMILDLCEKFGYDPEDFIIH